MWPFNRRSNQNSGAGRGNRPVGRVKSELRFKVQDREWVKVVGAATSDRAISNARGALAYFVNEHGHPDYSASCAVFCGTGADAVLLGNWEYDPETREFNWSPRD